MILNLHQKIRHFIPHIVFLSIAICTLTSTEVFASSQQKAVVRIGVYAPFTGSLAHIGNTTLEALQMANANDPSKHYQYRFFRLNQPLKGVEITQKQLNHFIQKNKLNALISLATTRGLKSAQAAKKNNIIHISVASDTKIADGQYNFINFSPIKTQVNTLVRYLKKSHVHSVSVINVDHAWSNPVKQAFVNAIKKQSSIKLINQKKFQPSTSNFSPLVSKLKKEKKPDAYFILAFTSHLQKIMPLMKKASLDAPVVSITTFNPSDNLTPIKGLYYVDVQIDQKFLRQFYNNTGHYPSTDAAYAYDSFMLLKKAFDQAKDVPFGIPSTDSVSKQLHKLHGVGVTGKFKVQNDGVIFTPSVIKIIR